MNVCPFACVYICTCLFVYIYACLCLCVLLTFSLVYMYLYVREVNTSMVAVIRMQVFSCGFLDHSSSAFVDWLVEENRRKMAEKRERDLGERFQVQPADYSEQKVTVFRCSVWLDGHLNS